MISEAYVDGYKAGKKVTAKRIFQELETLGNCNCATEKYDKIKSKFFQELEK